MTTLDSKRPKSQTDVESASGPSAALSPETSALITEEQVMLGSAAALAPAPSHRWSDAAHEVTAAVRAMFTRPEKPRARRHYPQRFGYLENAAMSRAMDRL